MNRRTRRAQWQASHRLAVGSAAVSGRPLPAASAPGAAIRLQIGELVLRGFERRRASGIAAAFERSLDQRLRGGALPASLRNPVRSTTLRLKPLTLRRASDPAAIGEQLAASVLALERDTRRGGSR